MSKPIPIAAAERIAKDYDYDQVIVFARKVGADGVEHMTTYGRTKEHCSVAARIGEFLQHKIMGWAAAPQGDDARALLREARAALLGPARLFAAMNAVKRIDAALAATDTPPREEAERGT